jgi:hypothetical protein
MGKPLQHSVRFRLALSMGGVAIGTHMYGHMRTNTLESNDIMVTGLQRSYMYKVATKLHPASATAAVRE